jgi:amidohydrolase
MPIVNRIAAFHDEMTAWRRHLHAHPELGFEETRTAAFVADKLKAFGVDEAHTGLAGTGVVGVVRAGSGQRAIGLRADMDALPIQEETGFPWASTHPGKMHACGHDGHTAMLLGAARHLAETRNFDGTVYLIFQPAEEVGGACRSGGARMLVEGLFERFPAERVFGLHNWPELPVGQFAMRPGPVMASVDDFVITIRGQGGHAAMPHLGRDPLVAGCQIVQALQSLVARELDPIDNAVVAVTRFHCGEAFNVVAETAELGGTVRAFRAATRTTLERRIGEIAQSIAIAMGVSATVDYRRGYPATVNEAGSTTLAAEAAADIVGASAIDHEPQPVMCAEDFAFMLETRPGAYIWMGIGGAEEGRFPHTPIYDFNDEALPLGASYWARLVERLLPRRPAGPENMA